MGRITEAFAYLNSTAEDWQKGRIHYLQFHYLSFSDRQKEARRTYQRQLKKNDKSNNRNQAS